MACFHAVLSVTLLQGVELSSLMVLSVLSASPAWLSVKISQTALLAASTAELGIRRAKGPLGRTLAIFSSLGGLIHLKYFRSAIFASAARKHESACT